MPPEPVKRFGGGRYLPHDLNHGAHDRNGERQGGAVDATGSDASKSEIKSYVNEALQEDKRRGRKPTGPTA